MTMLGTWMKTATQCLVQSLLCMTFLWAKSTEHFIETKMNLTWRFGAQGWTCCDKLSNSWMAQSKENKRPMKPLNINQNQQTKDITVSYTEVGDFMSPSCPRTDILSLLGIIVSLVQLLLLYHRKLLESTNFNTIWISQAEKRR